MLDDAELFQSLTAKPAEIWNLSGSGGIALGDRADLVVARRPAEKLAWDAFYALEPRDLLLVLKQGRIALIDADLEKKHPLEPTQRAAFSRIQVQGNDKWVRADVAQMRRETARHAPDLRVPFLT